MSAPGRRSYDLIMELDPLRCVGISLSNVILAVESKHQVSMDLLILIRQEHTLYGTWMV
jgi:hypothetical protein